MSESVNFAVGEPFPLPILAQADGGMFQVDKNGMMFLLQLSRADIVAGDAPLSLSLVKDELLPSERNLRDPTIHLYLVDTNLKILLAQRTARIPEEFAEIIRKNIRAQLAHPRSALAFQKSVSEIWAKYSAAELRAIADAAHTLPLSIGNAPLH